MCDQFTLGRNFRGISRNALTVAYICDIMVSSNIQGGLIVQIYAMEFKEYMDDNGIKYTEKKENVLQVIYEADNMESITIYVIFDPDNEPIVQFKCWDILSFKSNEAAALVVCNLLNAKYRWVKFYLDDDKDIVASIDARVDIDTCGEDCMDMVDRFVSILDAAYPEIARARWA